MTDASADDIYIYISQGQSTANCFSARSALSTYKQFLELDADKDGRLSAAEFAGFPGGFTRLFVDRVFEVHVQGALMSFDAFCDFQLAWRHRQHRASLAYLFRVLDVHARSSLGAEEVRSTRVCSFPTATDTWRSFLGFRARCRRYGSSAANQGCSSATWLQSWLI